MASPYYLSYEYIQDISNTINELKMKDISLNSDFNSFRSVVNDYHEFEDILHEFEDISQQIDATKLANYDYFINNKNQHSAWLNNMANKIKYLYDVSDNQKTIKTILDGEFILNEDKLDDIENEIVYQKKMNQLNTYYEKKRNYQIEIFKHISFVLFFLIIFSMLFHVKIVPETLFIFLIGIGLAYMVIYLGRVTIDMMFRDNIDFDVYNYPYSYTNIDKSREILDESLPLHAKNIKSSVVSNVNRTSKYVGVTWDKQVKKWKAMTLNNDNTKSLKLYDDEKEAAREYVKYATQSTETP